MLSPISKFYNQNIANLANLEKIPDENKFDIPHNCERCGKKKTMAELKAVMTDFGIKLLCVNH